MITLLIGNAQGVFVWASDDRVRHLMNELGVQPAKLEDHDDLEESKLFQRRSYLLLLSSILINYDEDCHLLTAVSEQRGRQRNQQSRATQHIPWTNGISAHSAPTLDQGGGGCVSRSLE